jgi:hypothetical protein
MELIKTKIGRRHQKDRRIETIVHKEKSISVTIEGCS